MCMYVLPISFVTFTHSGMGYESIAVGLTHMNTSVLGSYDSWDETLSLTLMDVGALVLCFKNMVMCFNNSHTLMDMGSLWP